MAIPGHKVLSDRLTIGFFLAVSSLPGIDRVVRPEVAESAHVENRPPRARPVLPQDLDGWQALPAACEEWFSDTMGMRDRLLRLRNGLFLFAARCAPSPEIVVGREGWLYYGGDRSIEVWRGLAPMTFDELEAWRAALEARREHARLLGAGFLFVVAPNKETIYPEKLPRALAMRGATRFDQVLEHLRARSDVEVLDLRAVLAAERAADRPGDFVYAPHGTHWTDRGAWVAAAQVLAWIRRSGAEAAPLDRRDFDLALSPSPTSDSWARNLYLEGWLAAPEWKLLPREPRARVPDPMQRDWSANARTSFVDGEGLPSVFLVHDSFGPWVRDLLAERCSRLDAMQTIAFPKHLIRVAKPRFVIEMRTERCFATPMTEWVEEPVELSAERFAAFAPAGPSDESALARARPFRNSRVEAQEDGSLVIEVTRVSGRVELGVGAGEGVRTAVRIDVESPAETDLCFYYTTPGEPRFLQRNVMRRRLSRGRQELHLLLPVAEIRALLLQPGEAEGRYRVHALELRAETADASAR